LIVEDDAMLGAAQARCRALRLEVHGAKDGLEALEMMRTGKFRLIISDWEMPGMTGVELCRHVRQKSSAGYTYLILLTSHSGRQSLVEGLKAGAASSCSSPSTPGNSKRGYAWRADPVAGKRDVVIFSRPSWPKRGTPKPRAHLERIREYCQVVAEYLCQVDKFRTRSTATFVQTLYLTSPLHDIGKVGIPDDILLKPGS